METVVAVFSYKRADKLRTVLRALEGAKIDRLYHFCDGPRSETDREAVEENRRVVQAFDGGFPQEVILREKNVGLAGNLVGGLNHVLARHETIIVLEDDIVPRAGFFEYMTSALERFALRKEIFSVSAYHALKDYDRPLPELFLSRRFFCWGWATWADRWHEISAEVTAGRIPYRQYWKVPTHSGGDFPWLVRSHYLGRNANLWAFKVALHTLARDWRHLCCRDILVENVGFDGSGENCADEAQTFGEPTMPTHDVATLPEPASDPQIDAAVGAAHAVDDGGFFKSWRRWLSYRVAMLFRR